MKETSVSPGDIILKQNEIVEDPKLYFLADGELELFIAPQFTVVNVISSSHEVPLATIKVQFPSTPLTSG